MLQRFIDYVFALKHHLHIDSKTKNYLELNKTILILESTPPKNIPNKRLSTLLKLKKK